MDNDTGFVNIGDSKNKKLFSYQLIDNLKYLLEANKKDWDFKILISGDGMTRTGKSTIASQIAYYLDPKITLDQVIFRGSKLVELSKKLQKGRAIIYDEAREGLDSKMAVTKYSKNILDYFNECGYKNQIMIIVLPEFFDLTKMVALNQSVCLINCFCKNGFNRGYFGFYSRQDKRMLYIKGKKFNNYSSIKPTFVGRFKNWFPFDHDEYNRLKDKNFAESRDEEGAKDSRKYLTCNKMLYKIVELIKKHYGLKAVDIARAIVVPNSF